MQSERYIDLVDQIVHSLTADDLSRITVGMLPGGQFSLNADVFAHAKESFFKLIFEAQARLFNLIADDEIEPVLASLEVRHVFEPKNITALIYALQSSDGPSVLHKNYHWMNVLVRFNAVLSSLVLMRDSMQKLVSRPRLGAQNTSTEILRFEVLDLRQDGFGFDRLEEILPSLHALVSEHCRVFDVDESQIRIAYLDSGSGLTIAIKGDLKVISSIKSLFIAIWDKVRFRKIDDFKEKLEAVDGSLEVLAKIKAKQDSGTIDPGEAARLKHVILAETMHLLQTGTNLQELQNAEVVRNEALLIQMVIPKFLTESAEEAK
jgi:hypothetical protein